jgi:hypothetical protein
VSVRGGEKGRERVTLGQWHSPVAPVWPLVPPVHAALSLAVAAVHLGRWLLRLGHHPLLLLALLPLLLLRNRLQGQVSIAAVALPARGAFRVRACERMCACTPGEGHPGCCGNAPLLTCGGCAGGPPGRGWYV